jgi:hypothetical protein
VARSALSGFLVGAFVVAPQQGFATRSQLGNPERLCHVIVCAASQKKDLMLFLGLDR